MPASAAADLVQHLLEAIERPVEIAPRNDKGRRKPHHSPVCSQTSRALATAGSISAPTHNPRPRTSLSAG
jgi:hypothetical protein